MGIFKKNDTVDPTQPLHEESGSTPADEATQAEPEKEAQAEAEAPEDKGIFNCVPCKGTGLIGDPYQPGNFRCNTCQGTGKVN
ncbi:MAG TPA: hypothetical protein VF941_02905 [Clostridia bacterium]